jgi:hypothetical protein
MTTQTTQPPSQPAAPVPVRKPVYRCNGEDCNVIVGRDGYRCAKCKRIKWLQAELAQAQRTRDILRADRDGLTVLLAEREARYRRVCARYLALCGVLGVAVGVVWRLV